MVAIAIISSKDRQRRPLRLTELSQTGAEPLYPDHGLF